MADGRPLDWDMGSAQAIDGAQPILAPGIYMFEVTKLERGRYKGGSKIGPCPEADITVSVMGMAEDGSGMRAVSVQEKLKLWGSEFCIGLIGAFFRSIGAPSNPDGSTAVNWDRDFVIGRTGFCEIGTREYDSNGETRRINDIKRFIAPDAVPAAVGPFDQSLQPSQPAAAPQFQQMPQSLAYQAVPQAVAGAQPVARGF